MFWPARWINNHMTILYKFLKAGRGPMGYADRKDPTLLRRMTMRWETRRKSE